MTARRRRTRNPDAIDALVLGSLEKMRKEKGDNFRASVTMISDAIDGRGNVPSRASVYRAVDRLVQSGKVVVTRKGERGNYAYSFGGGTAPAVATPALSTDKTLPLNTALAALDEALSAAKERDALQKRVTELESQLESLVTKIMGSMARDRVAVA